MMKYILSVIASILVTIAVAPTLTSQPVKGGNKITISPPALQNGGDADAWVRSSCKDS